MENTEKISLRNVCIIGLGYTGTSIALGLKRSQCVQHLAGYDMEAEKSKKCKSIGAIDEIASDLRSACDKRDFIILATPVTRTLDLIPEVARFCNPGCTITDISQTKEEVVSKADKFFPKNRYFIGSHPLKSPPKQIPAVSDPDIFLNQICFIATSNVSSHKAVADVTMFWQTLGSVPIAIRADRHDYLLSVIKHMTYLSSVILTNSIQNMLTDEFDFINKIIDDDFKSAVKPSATVIEPWINIIDTNKDNIMKTLINLRDEADYLIKSLESNKIEQAKQKLKKARDYSTQIK